jgi:hypothetical protein
MHESSQTQSTFFFCFEKECYARINKTAESLYFFLPISVYKLQTHVTGLIETRQFQFQNILLLQLKFLSNQACVAVAAQRFGFQDTMAPGHRICLEIICNPTHYHRLSSKYQLG